MKTKYALLREDDFILDEKGNVKIYDTRRDAEIDLDNVDILDVNNFEIVPVKVRPEKRYVILTAVRDKKTYEVNLDATHKVRDLEDGFEKLKKLYKEDHAGAKHDPMRYVGIIRPAIKKVYYDGGQSCYIGINSKTDGEIIDKYYTDDGFSLVKVEDKNPETYQHAYWRREVDYYINNMEDLSEDEKILKMSDEEVDDIASLVADDILEDSDILWGNINDRIEELVRERLEEVD